MSTLRLRRRHASHDLPEMPGVHPLLNRVYAQRGIADAGELDLALGRLLDPSTLSGLAPAVELLADAVTGGRRILIVGDFDADGATSTALMLRTLRAMGAGQVEYLVPNRFRYGYGLTPGMVELAAERCPDLIVTVDNGISSVAGVADAKRRGIQVLVTDHHLPGAELPDADAIVNPNQPGDAFPSKHLAGVGVAFYVMAALRAQLRTRGWFRRKGLTEPRMADSLDLVALGTVADVVPLDRNNRILVEQGLRRIRSGQGNAGIQALLNVAGRPVADAVGSDLGFAVGPRLNAAGRLQDMSLGIECLLTDDVVAALTGARRLDALNRERRDLEEQMREDARVLLERLDRDRTGKDLPPGLCLYDPSWHQGVIGILAARIKERYHRPVIAFADGPDGGLKGSARSIPGLHIRDLLDTVAVRCPGLIDHFGGHAMAAGLSLSREKLPAFRVAFEQAASSALNDELLQGEVWSDGPLEARDLTLSTAEALRRGGPWGPGFPAPLFDGPFRVKEWRVVGSQHLKLRLQDMEGSGRPVDAIAFGKADRAPRGDVWHLVYQLDVNTYQGGRSPQLVVEHLWTCD